MEEGYQEVRKAGGVGTYMRRKSERVKPVYSRKTDKKITDRRLTTCKNCGFGIFLGQLRDWTSRGLVHRECEVKSEVKNST